MKSSLFLTMKQENIVVSSKIKQQIERIIASQIISGNVKTELKKLIDIDNDNHNDNHDNSNNTIKDDKKISFADVRKLQDALYQMGEKVYLHELLDGSEICMPSYEPPPRDPELEARIQRLKAEQGNREYAEMTANFSLKKPKDLSIGQEMRSINRQITGVVNFFVTVVGAFVFGYKCTEVVTGEYNVVTQLMVGMILSTIVFFADIYFLIKYS